MAHTPSFVKTFPKFFGNPEEHTILEFAEIILRMIGGGSKIVFKELPVDDRSRGDRILGRRDNCWGGSRRLGWRRGWRGLWSILINCI
jgi:nucleoside-diphosphate-sugar epimerase